MSRPKGSKNKPKDQTMPTKTADKPKEQVDMIDDAEVTEVERLPVVHQSMAITPMSMIDRAITAGADINVIEKLMNLHERWEAMQARKAFDRAMADAKAEIPTITKNRAVDFTSQKGRTNYRYEDLESVASAVGPILSKYGLSYRYRATSNVNEPVTVTCIVSHRDGHFEELTLAAGRDDSGNKNSIQAISSTMTYLQRISLKAALGLAVSNDDDGQTSEEKPRDNGPPRQPAKPQPQSRDGTPPRREQRMDEARKNDPISTGPQQRAAPRDTGPKAKPVEPFKLPGTGETFESWSEKYIDHIKTSPDTATVYKWIDVNSDPLGRLTKGKPSVYATVKKATEGVMEQLRDAQTKAKEKTDKATAKPAAPSDMDEATADEMDRRAENMGPDDTPDYGAPADDNPETILKWIETTLAAVDSADDLENVWVQYCEPKILDLFPPDKEEAQGIYRRHEKRLEP